MDTDETTKDTLERVDIAPRYTLTVEQASTLFIEGGVPRSPRTVMRYCGNGLLDCTKVDTERTLKYLVALDSIEKRIEELRQIESISYVSSRRDASRHDAPSHDTTRRDETRDETTEKLTNENAELKKEMEDLKILNAGKDYLVQQFKDATSGRPSGKIGHAAAPPRRTAGRPG